MKKTTFNLKNISINDATAVRHSLSMNVGIAFDNVIIYKNTASENINNDHLTHIICTCLQIPIVPDNEHNILYFKNNLEILTGCENYTTISDNILIDERKYDFRKKNLSIAQSDEYKIVCNVINTSDTDVRIVTTNDCICYKNGKQIDNLYTYFDSEGIYICKLNPAIKDENKNGEEVHFEATSMNGIALHNAKYKVFTNSHIYYDDDDTNLTFNVFTLPHPMFNAKSIVLQTIKIIKMFTQILLEKAIADNHDINTIEEKSIFVNNDIDNNIVSYLVLKDDYIKIVDDLYCKEKYSKSYKISNAKGQKPADGEYFFELKNGRVYIDEGRYHFDDIKYPSEYKLDIHIIKMCNLLIVSRLQQHKNVLLAGDNIDNIIQEKGSIVYTLDNAQNHISVINDVFTDILNFLDNFTKQIEQHN